MSVVNRYDILDDESCDLWVFRLCRPGFDLRVENWVRWCRAAPSLDAHCGSIEHRYINPQGVNHPNGWGDWHNDVPVRNRSRIDALDAVVMNCAFVRLEDNHRRVIRLSFFRAAGFDVRRMARRMRSDVMGVKQMLAAALLRFELFATTRG